MLQRIIRTQDAIAPLILRLVLGAVLLGHGLQKLFGWFGGYGLEGTLGFFAGLGIPALLGVLIIALETLGSLALISGALTRLWAFAVIGLMAGAVATVHGQYGFWMNWSGQQGGEGFEYHLLVVAMAAALVLLGGGRLSVDRAIARTA